MSPVPNIWRVLYGDPVPEEQTRRECDFIEQIMPRPEYRAILDLACGAGRHSIELSARGYDVIGADIDRRALDVATERAAERGVSPEFVELDLRHLEALDRRFDGIILFWQSYGFFKAEAQVGIFAQFRRLLRMEGRFVLDIFNRHYYERGVDEREQRLLMTPTLPQILGQDERIFSMLGYEDDLRFERRAADLYDTELADPGGISGIAANHGLKLILICRDFVAGSPATPDRPRMQMVFERGD